MTPQRHNKIESIALQEGFSENPAGVVEFINTMLAKGMTDRDIETKLGLSQAYLKHYFSRKNIRIITVCPRVAVLEEEMASNV